MVRRIRVEIVVIAAFVFVGACQEPASTPVPPADAGPVDVTAPDVGSDVVPDEGPPVDTIEPTDEGPADVAPEDVTPEDVGPVACDPPLQLEPLEPVAATYSTVMFVPSGGTGAYRFELVENPSGAILNELTGIYLSGPTGDMSDTIQLTDMGCIGVVETTITVVSDPQLTPEMLSIPPQTCVDFQVVGGSGQFEFSLIGAEPVGTLTPTGQYTAGAVEGTDIVYVRDVLTDRTDETTISIQAGTELASTTERLALPLGAVFPVPVELGSGQFEVAVDGDAIEYDDEAGTLLAIATGASTVTVTDSIIGCGGDDGQSPLSVSIPVDVVTALDVQTAHQAAGGTIQVHGPGDLNGDGFPDAVVGWQDSNWSGVRSGAVMVYAGSADGLGDGPAQIIAEDNGALSNRDRDSVRRILVRDLNGDGEPELAVASWSDDSQGDDFGTVALYKGIADGFFEEDPYQSLFGDKKDDYFGASIAACDFNNDQLMDLVVGSETAEDETADPVKNQQGAISVFLGTADGFADTPDLLRFGVYPKGDNGAWQGITTLEFGHALAVGDYNGDQVCDVAVSAERYKTGGKGNGYDGAVFLYLGDPTTGLSETPVRLWEASGNGRFGHAMAMGDLDGDGFDDLVVTKRLHKDGTKKQAGGIFVFRGQAITAETPVVNVAGATADWSVVGDRAYALHGRNVRVADVNSDGHLDLVATAEKGKEYGSESNLGSMIVYLGQANALPSRGHGIKHLGLAKEDKFGRTAAAIGDLNGDGLSEFVVGASHADEDGLNNGMTYLIWGHNSIPIDWQGEWLYNADNVDPGADWTALTYDDSTWAVDVAQFGYGESDQNTDLSSDKPKITSFYFRKTITLDAAHPDATLTVLYDDGVAVWINGQNVLTEKMDNGLEHEKYSNGNTENTLAEVVFDAENPSPLVVGENIIAVMVKPRNENDTDLSFDLKLVTAATADYVALNTPRKRSNSLAGRSLAFVDDITGDGLADLLVGVPWDTPFGSTAYTGAVHGFAGESGSVSSTASAMWSGMTLHASRADLGWRVAGAGDVNKDGQADIAMLARYRDRPATMPENVVPLDGCSGAKADQGAVYVMSANWSETSEGDDPLFVIYGPQTSQLTEAMTAGLDYNGDGYDDIVTGSYRWDRSGATNVGGVAFYAGRPSDPSGKTTVICKADTWIRGNKKDDDMGYSLAAVGDLNSDGCDEVVVGAHREDPSNQGAIRLFYGWGPNCALATPHVALFMSGANNSYAGRRVIAGQDVDGDGLPDVVVGGYEYRVGSLRLGAAWLLSGAHLQTGASFPVVDDFVPPGATATPFIADGVEASTVRLVGGSNYGHFGLGLAFVPGVGPSGVSVAVGSQRGDFSGVDDTGGAQIFGYDPNGETPGFIARPLLTFGGESFRRHGYLGRMLSATMMGSTPVLAVGGFKISPIDQDDRIDDGGVYVIPLDPNL